MNQINYQKELEKLLQRLERKHEEGAEAPTLFLHSCCAPCSSYVLEYLCGRFRITVFYFNPNISESAEYVRRVEEQKRLITAYNDAISEEYAPDRSVQDEEKNDNMRCLIDIVEGDYEPQSFYEIARGLEQCPEGGERCFACYELRLRETAKRAQAGKYDYFATTLTISPLKNAVKLNEIGERLAAEYGVSWLPSDFKKKGGYQRSIELSKEYDLYRQDYCGCAYSREERERQRS